MEPLWPTLLALAAVCALALVSLRLLARRAAAAPRALRVVARLALEPRRSIYLVEACGRFLLIGVGDGPLSVLAELDGAAAQEAVAGSSSAISLGDAFAEAWRRIVRGDRAVAGPSASEGGEAAPGREAGR
jgi:flagellar biogenesis protein FliO